ncbi:hypothetical protein D4R42_02445 [bacterium]|nr:MAG: hypothetical protein D4R42_02445 [bacterium]
MSMMPKEAPHRVVNDILDGLLNGVKGAGEAITSGLDSLPLGTNGPHRGVDKVLDGLTKAPEDIGEGISEALDLPLQAVK